MRGRRCAWLVVTLVSSLVSGATVAAVRTDPLVDSCATNDDNCCFPASKWPKGSTGSRFRCEADADGSYPCSVKLGINDWIGSFINVYVAKIFIEEFLGYPVEITADATDFTGTADNFDEVQPDGTVVTRSVWDLMSSGDVDAILEYWPSGHAENVRKFVVEEATVVAAGANGIEGRIGWFMPSYAKTDHDPTLEYWGTLMDPAKAGIFAHPASSAPCCRSDWDQTDDYMPCMPTEALGGTAVADGGMADAAAECDAVFPSNVTTSGGRYLGGKPDWTQHDEQLIRNLGLPLTTAYAGSESNILREIERAASSSPRLPLVFYFWKPHGAFHLYDFDLVDVLLPLSSAECRVAEATGDSTCGYPIETLSKAYSKSLEFSKPDVAHFLGAMAFNSTAQQEEIHLKLLIDPSRTLNDVACEWAQANEATWFDWTESVERQFKDAMWLDETLEPTVHACDCKPDGMREVVAVYDKSQYEADGSVQIDVDAYPCAAARNASVYRTRWSTSLHETVVWKEIACAHVPVGSPGQSTILAIAAVAWGIFTLCLVLLLHYRKHTAVKSARIKTLVVLLLGAALMNSAEIFQIGEPTTAKCAGRFTALLVGFSYFVGALLIKQLVITSIMKRASRLKRRKSRVMRLFLRFDVLVCSLAAGVLLLLWFFVVGFAPIRVTADVLLNVEETVCPTNSTLLMLVVGLCYVLIVVSCILASQTRGLSGLIFNEGKFMLFSNYNVAVLTALSLFVTLSPGMDATLKSLFVSFCIFFSTVSCAVLVVGTRAYAAGFDVGLTVIGTATTQRTAASSVIRSSLRGESKPSTSAVRSQTRSNM